MGLLNRMDAAVDGANARLFTHRAMSLQVLESNDLAAGVHDFHTSLDIEADPRSWSAKHLGRGADLGSQAIQAVKDHRRLLGLGVLAASSTGLKARLPAAKALLDKAQAPHLGK